MTTYFSTLPFSVGPPSLPYVRVPTRIRPTYLTSSSIPPRSLRSSFPRRRYYFFQPKSTMPAAAAADVDELKFPVELTDESDFDRIVSSDGLITICGFGSLLSEKSARSTFPDLINFRMAKLSGFRRVFAHVAPIFFERGIAKPETKEISSLSVEPCEGETLIVTIFEIQRSEIPAFIEREHEFRFLAVIPETLNELFYINPAVIKTSSSSGMDGTILTIFGEMIYSLAVSISAIVFWQLKILVIWPTTTFLIIPSLVTVELQYASTCQQLVLESWKKSLQSC